jgi:hypothetical protein
VRSLRVERTVAFVVANPAQCEDCQPFNTVRWHRQFVARHWTYEKRACGRPPTAAAIRDLVIRFARENPTWGHRRIHGEVASLGQKISAATVWNILNKAGVGPDRADLEAVLRRSSQNHAGLRLCPCRYRVVTINEYRAA